MKSILLSKRLKLNKSSIVLGANFILFSLLGYHLIHIAPTIEIAWVLNILLLTIFLFVFEIIAIDLTAICIMVLLGISTIAFESMGLSAPLIDKEHLFDGFKSNAVISIMAVMIIGAGLDFSGIMATVAKYIMRLSGDDQSRITSAITATVGVVSSFMQNVGATALFLPVISRISSRTGIPMSKLLMPMGFCAILGGTITLVGSSPLILLNDLIATSNQSLTEENQIQQFGLFSVTPIGLALLAVGIGYFLTIGKHLLPKSKALKTDASMSTSYYQKTYGLDYEIAEIRVPRYSELVGKTLADFETKFQVRTLAMHTKGITLHGKGFLPLDQMVHAKDIIVIIGKKSDITRFTKYFELIKKLRVTRLAEIINASQAGLSEAVVHPNSPLVGCCAKDHHLRSIHGVSTLAIIRGEEVVSVGEDVRSMEFMAGDTIIFFSNWKDLNEFEQQKEMVIITSNYPKEVVRSSKAYFAITGFVVALGFILFSDLALSISLLIGAIIMILTKVLSIEEAYQAISWKTVFLLASLIPLGMAVDQSGTAKWVANIALSALNGFPIWGIQLVIAILATLFSLVMSNVGATVLLVPLAISIAQGVGADPAMFAITVALATSNAFLIPTHQVNALIMGPGGYKVIDFLKVGGIMTILFLVVLIIGLNLVF